MSESGQRAFGSPVGGLPDLFALAVETMEPAIQLSFPWWEVGEGVRSDEWRGGRGAADKCFEQGWSSWEHWKKSTYSRVSLEEREGFCAHWQMQILLGKPGYKGSLEEYVKNGNANYKAKESCHRLCIGDGCVIGTPFQLSVSSPQKER